MLIKLEVENFRSFNERHVFHMVQRNYKRFNEHVHVVNDNLKILKVTGIYGGNASGKTNLFKALYVAKMMVESSNFLKKIEARNILIPFRLENNRKLKPTVFVVDFISRGKVFNYELKVLTEPFKVISESLIKLEVDGSNIVFERTINEKGETIVSFPKSDSLEKDIAQTVSKLTPSYSTFLSFDISITPDIEDAKDWFVNQTKFVFPLYEFGDIAYTLSLKDEYLDLANRIIKFANTGINKLKIDEIPIELYLGAENSTLISQISSNLNDKKFHSFKDSKGTSCTAIRRSDDKIVVLKLLTVYLNDSRDEVVFELDQESRGVIVLLHLLPSFILSYGEGVNFFIDEIGASIHPVLLKEILSQYLENNIEHAKGQLIFNTHEDFIMDETILRQDEIWLVEKGRNGDSTIFPLSDFSNIRFDLNLRKNYLNGRFGGVPFDRKPDKLLFETK